MGRILIVEDNPQDARLTMKAMQANGMGNLATIFPTGEALVEFFDRRRQERNGNCAAGVSLVLLDLNLPGLQGLEVLRQLRECPCCKTLPVIVFTTEDSPERIRDCYAAGANSYIVKSIDFEEFVRAVGLTADYWIGLNRTAE